jgi:hypothetical protein
MEHGSLLPQSQQHKTCPYSKPGESSPRSYPTSWRYILILRSQIRLGFPSRVFLRYPYGNALCTSPFPSRATCHNNLIVLATPCIWNLLPFLISYRTRIWVVEIAWTKEWGKENVVTLLIIKKTYRMSLRRDTAFYSLSWCYYILRQFSNIYV